MFVEGINDVLAYFDGQERVVHVDRWSGMGVGGDKGWPTAASLLCTTEIVAAGCDSYVDKVRTAHAYSPLPQAVAVFSSPVVQEGREQTQDAFELQTL